MYQSISKICDIIFEIKLKLHKINHAILMSSNVNFKKCTLIKSAFEFTLQMSKI